MDRRTREPSGVAYDPTHRRLLTADDDNDRIFDVRPGADARVGTPDDAVSQIDVRVFGDSDTEDVAPDTTTGEVPVVDARRGRINKLSPGDNGRFDGVPPTGDDKTRCFDISEAFSTKASGLVLAPASSG